MSKEPEQKDAEINRFGEAWKETVGTFRGQRYKNDLNGQSHDSYNFMGSLTK